jgi:CheY-like chemotaxis protein
MPGVDGYELLARLRETPHGAAIPAIALSAYTSPEDVEHARRAGFAAHLAKPARFDVLARAIRAAYRSASGASSGSETSRHS